jgi:uncharacterized protein DUF6930
MAKRKPPKPAGPPPEHFFKKELAGETPLSLPTASGLCQAALELRKASPWESLEEDQLVFATWPGAPTTYTCSILGTLGEVLALVVYPGAEGYHFFAEMHEDGAMDFDRFIYHADCLKMELVERSDLTRQDRELLTAAGFPSGGRAPQFRSQRPGYFPWYINQDEGDVLRECAGAFLAAFNGSVLEPWDRPGYYPQAVRRAEGGYDIELVPPPARPVRPTPQPPAVDPTRLASAAGKRKGAGLTLEIDCFAGPPIGRAHERPAVARVALAVDTATGMVVYNHVYEPAKSEGEVLIEVLLGAIETGRAAPSTVRIRTAAYKALLAPFAETLGFRAAVSADLPALDEAKDALLNNFLRR